MKLNSFSPIPNDDKELYLPENDDKELYLPELVYAASLGDIEQVEKLLSQGIDANQMDEEGYSALHAAAENDHLDILKLLVSQGADVHYKAQFTALELAEMANNKEIVEYLKKL